MHAHYGREWTEDDDDAMIRSEEEVTVDTVRKPTERVRLKKVIVEHEVTETVPVRKEKIQLETDPPPEGRIESVEDLGEGTEGSRP